MKEIKQPFKQTNSGWTDFIFKFNIKLTEEHNIFKIFALNDNEDDTS